MASCISNKAFNKTSVNYVLHGVLPQYYANPFKKSKAQVKVPTSGQQHESAVEEIIKKSGEFYEPNFYFTVPHDIQQFFHEKTKRFDFAIKYKGNILIIEAKFQQSTGTCKSKIRTSCSELFHIANECRFQSVIVCAGAALDKKFIQIEKLHLHYNRQNTHVKIIHISELLEFINNWKSSHDKA